MKGERFALNKYNLKKWVKKTCPIAGPIYRNLSKSCKLVKNQIYNYYDNPVIVLLYHRVADLETDPQLLAISIENFEAQIKFLKKNYSILKFEDKWENIKKPSVVITFDDGYVDNYVNALPVLEKYQVPATIFVTTGNINTSNEFWWDDLERLLLLNKKLPQSYCLGTSKGKYKLSFLTTNAIKKSYDLLHLILKDLQFEERIAVLKNMEAELNPLVNPRKLYRTMNEKELIEIDRSLYITIGGHTVTHTQLSIQNIDIQKTEIEESKKKLEVLLQRKINVFSYPFGGKNDYTKDTIDILKNIGYQKVASNYMGQIHSWNKNEFELPRCLIRNWDENVFKKILKSFFIEG